MKEFFLSVHLFSKNNYFAPVNSSIFIKSLIRIRGQIEKLPIPYIVSRRKPSKPKPQKRYYDFITF